MMIMSPDKNINEMLIESELKRGQLESAFLKCSKSGERNRIRKQIEALKQFEKDLKERRKEGGKKL